MKSSGTEKVDVANLKKTVNVKGVLSDLGIHYKVRREGTELMLQCINPDHEDKSLDSLHMNARNDDWNGCYKCAACGITGDLIKYLTLVSENNFKQIIDYLQGFGEVKIQSSVEDTIKRRTVTKEIVAADLPEISIRYNRFSGNVWCESAQERHLDGRNINKSIAVRNCVGWSDSFPFNERYNAPHCIVVPVKFEGRLVSYFLRSWSVPFFKKINKLYPPNNIAISRVPYGIDQCSGEYPTIVVEGIYDRLVVDSALDEEGIVYDTISFYSNNPTKYHLDELAKKNPPEIILLPDRDGAPGAKLCEIVGKKFMHDVRVTIAEVPVGKDPGDCSYEEIIRALDNRRDWVEYVVENELTTGRRYTWN